MSEKNSNSGKSGGSQNKGTQKINEVQPKKPRKSGFVMVMDSVDHKKKK